jgi:hypothetical protein
MNPYVHFYKQAGKTMTENPNTEYKIILKGKNCDKRYAAPVTDEVAILMVTDSEENPAPREIVLTQKGTGKLLYIQEHHSSYDPLHYVLMFINGEQGWQHHTYPIPNSTKFVSALKYYSFQIMDRLGNNQEL